MQFINYNANVKGKKTSDCAIRAICTALNTSWEETYRDLANYSIEKGLMLNDKRAIEGYLKVKGYKMQKMPKHEDRTRYTIQEFIDEIAKPYDIYILDIACHLTLVKNKVLIDTWDCSCKSVGNFWIIRQVI